MKKRIADLNSNKQSSSVSSGFVIYEWFQEI